MSPVTHFLTGWAVANAVPSLSKRERAFVTWASVIPDADGLGIVAELGTRHADHPLNWWSQYHHVLCHNLGFALLVCSVTAALSRQRFKTTILAAISFHLHLLGDLIGARGPDGEQWPIPYLLPFSNHVQLTWSGQWALNAWPNLSITAGLIAVMILVAIRRGVSPLEMFSARANTLFVSALRARFGPPKSSTTLCLASISDPRRNSNGPQAVQD